MSIQKINPRTVVLLLMILVIGIVRTILNFNHDLHPFANFSPVGAMAIFGGAYFDKKWKAFLFPLCTLFLSDYVLSLTVFKPYSHGFLYGGWYWVYSAIALITLAGRWIMKKITVRSFLISVIASTIIHWIVTDLGVWIGSKTYTQDLSGFLDCLAVAIPYELRFISATLVYGMILFGAFEWMKRRVKLVVDSR